MVNPNLTVSELGLQVEGIEDVGEARIVNYKCVGRFMIKSVKIHHPFHVADVDWVTDYPPDMPGAGSSGATRDRLEREVWQSLNDVANLTAKLNRVGSPVPLPQDWLPAQVRQFAPVSLWTLSKPAPNRHVAAGGYPSLKKGKLSWPKLDTVTSYITHFTEDVIHMLLISKSKSISINFWSS